MSSFAESASHIRGTLGRDRSESLAVLTAGLCVPDMEPDPSPSTSPAGGDSGRAAGAAASGDHVHILDVDPDLGDGLEPEVFARARHLLRARVVILDRAHPCPPRDLDPRTTFGLLVMDGLMGRRVRVGQAQATELLGPGDILRPWDQRELLESVPPEVDWRVFKRVRLAILDGEVTRLIGRRPELVIAFSGRLMGRVRVGSYLRAVSHLSRVDEKVLVTLWHIAGRWGSVTPTGVVIPFRLTHEVLGEIVGAQRPSVTLALNRMRRTGILERLEDGRLVLLGAPSDWRAADGGGLSIPDVLGAGL